MLDSAEAARRRELQERVYAPGGSLTDAEIAELHDLDKRNLAVLVAPLVPADPPVRGAQHVASGAGETASGVERVPQELRPAAPELLAPEPAAREPAAREPAAPELVGPELVGPGTVRGAQHAASDPGDAAIPAPQAEQRSRRRWLLPVIAVVVILLGFVFGRFVLGSGADSVPMNAAQQDAWAKLEGADTYVPGSVTLLGSKYGADVWTAHRKETDVECMILTRADDKAEACGMLEPEQGDFNLQATLAYTDDGVNYSLYATVARDMLGNPISILQRYANEEFDWRSTFSDAELTTVHTLEAAGFDGSSLSIIGYDGDVPVWVYQNERYCMMIVRDDVVAQQCSQFGADSSQTLSLNEGDAVYTVQSSENRGPVLTITRIPDFMTEG